MQSKQGNDDLIDEDEGDDYMECSENAQDSSEADVREIIIKINLNNVESFACFQFST